MSDTLNIRRDPMQLDVDDRQERLDFKRALDAIQAFNKAYPTRAVPLPDSPKSLTFDHLPPELANTLAAILPGVQAARTNQDGTVALHQTDAAPGGFKSDKARLAFETAHLRTTEFDPGAFVFEGRAAKRARPSDKRLDFGAMDLRGVTTEKVGRGVVLQAQRAGRDIQQRVDGQGTTFTVSDPAGVVPPVTVSRTGSQGIYTSLKASSYDAHAFLALRSNADGVVTGNNSPMLEGFLTAYKALHRAGLADADAQTVLDHVWGRTSDGNGVPRGDHSPRLYYAYQQVGEVASYLNKQGFAADEITRLLTVLAKRAPHAQGSEAPYYQDAVANLVSKLGAVDSPNAAGIEALHALVKTDGDGGERRLLVFLSDSSVGGAGAEAPIRRLADNGLDGDATDAILAGLQRAPTSPAARQKWERWADAALFELEQAKQRYASLPDHAAAVALIDRMAQQIEARRSGAGLGAVARIDAQAAEAAQKVKGSGQKSAIPLVFTADVLAGFLARVDVTLVPTPTRETAQQRAEALAAREPAMGFAIVDKGFGEDGRHRGYDVVGMPETQAKRVLVPKRELTPAQWQGTEPVKIDGEDHFLVGVTGDQMLMEKDVPVLGDVATQTLNGEGALVSLVVGAKVAMPSAFPGTALFETRIVGQEGGIRRYEKGLRDGLYHLPPGTKTDDAQQNAQLTRMFMRVKDTLRGRLAASQQHFQGWKDDPQAMLKAFVAMYRQQGWEATRAAMVQMLGYDFSVTRDSAIPVLNVIAKAAAAESAADLDHRVALLVEDPDFKEAVSRLDATIDHLQAGKDDLDGIHDGDPNGLFRVLDSMPAMREEMYRQMGLGFNPHEALDKQPPQNAAETVFQSRYEAYHDDQRSAALWKAGGILAAAIVLTAVTGGLAGPAAAAAMGFGIGVGQSYLDVSQANDRVDQTRAYANAGLDFHESVQAAETDARWAKFSAVVNIGTGPLTGLVNGGAATGWLRSMLFDAAIGMGQTALDGRTYNGSQGDAVESLLIAGAFGAAGSVGGRVAGKVMHPQTLTPTTQTGDPIRMVLNPESREVRVLAPDGQVLRKGVIEGRGYDHENVPTNELILRDMKTGEVFSVVIGNKGVQREPVAEPLASRPTAAAGKAGTRVTDPHPASAAPQAPTAIEPRQSGTPAGGDADREVGIAYNRAATEEMHLYGLERALELEPRAAYAADVEAGGQLAELDALATSVPDGVADQDRMLAAMSYRSALPAEGRARALPALPARVSRQDPHWSTTQSQRVEGLMQRVRRLEAAGHPDAASLLLAQATYERVLGMDPNVGYKVLEQWTGQLQSSRPVAGRVLDAYMGEVRANLRLKGIDQTRLQATYGPERPIADLNPNTVGAVGWQLFKQEVGTVLGGADALVAFDNRFLEERLADPDKFKGARQAVADLAKVPTDQRLDHLEALIQAKAGADPQEADVLATFHYEITSAVWQRGAQPDLLVRSVVADKATIPSPAELREGRLKAIESQMSREFMQQLKGDLAQQKVVFLQAVKDVAGTLPEAQREPFLSETTAVIEAAKDVPSLENGVNALLKSSYPMDTKLKLTSAKFDLMDAALEAQLVVWRAKAPGATAAAGSRVVDLVPETMKEQAAKLPALTAFSLPAGESRAVEAAWVRAGRPGGKAPEALASEIVADLVNRKPALSPKDQHLALRDAAAKLMVTGGTENTLTAQLLRRYHTELITGTVSTGTAAKPPALPIFGRMADPKQAAAVQAAVDEARTTIARLVSQRMIDRAGDVDVMVHDDPNFRAYYDGSGHTGALHIGPNTDVATIVHEYGHHLETKGDPAVWDATYTYLLRRVGPDAKMRSIGRTGGTETMGNEFALVPRDAAQALPNPYMSKVYASGDTEVLSMGIEMMARDPAGLYLQDPSLFAFIANVLKGDAMPPAGL